MNFRLALLLLLGFSIHISTFGSRTASPLIALQRGESAFTVGALLSAYWFVPIFFAIAAGRWTDRVGARKPLLISSALQVAGLLIPALVPGVPAMATSAVLIGSAHIVGVIALTNSIGASVSAESRGSAFVWLTMSFSAGITIGPPIAGFALEHFGPRAPYGAIALIVAAIALLLVVNRHRIPDAHAGAAAAADGQVMDLLRQPVIRRVLLIGVVGPISWELYYVFVPLHGTAIGLSPSTIGSVMSVFAIAIIVVRIFSPVLQRRLAPWPLLGWSFGCAACCLATFPLTTNATMLAVASFVFGLCMGLSAPLQMYLTYEATPPGRKGEVAGLRQTVFNVIATLAPTTLATLSAAIGFGPVVWVTAAGMGLAGRLAWLTGRMAKQAKP